MKDDISSSIERIKRMEAMYVKACDVMVSLDKALSDYESVRGMIDSLSEYYGSRKWREDLQNDEDGLLPDDLRRGVLSEDGIYDLLEKNDEFERLFSKGPEDKDEEGK